jgi:ABC-type uncharacterized transport system involved in gliding motility auxiliary subunit
MTGRPRRVPGRRRPRPAVSADGSQVASDPIENEDGLSPVGNGQDVDGELSSALGTPTPGRSAAPSNASGDDIPSNSAFYRFSTALGVLALVLIAGGLVWSNISGEFNRNSVALLVLGAVMGVLYAIPRLGEIGAMLGTRTARQGGNATLFAVGFIGLLVVGNWFVNRHSPQWDLTASKRYSLSDQTVKVLSSLKQDVKITAFFPTRQGEDAYTRGTKDLLRQYDRLSDHVTVQFIDPDVEPGLARQFNITMAPVTIFQMGDRREETPNVTEQDFTSALLKLSRTEKKKIYILQGHQERDPDAATPNGLSQASDALKRENYIVEKFSFLASPAVPADAAVLIVPGPKAALLDPERQALQTYLDNGGKVLFLAEPRADAGLGPLLDQWYISLNNDLVVDPGRSYPGDPFTPAPIPQPGHRITTTIPDVLMPGSRSVVLKQGAGSDVAIAPILRTTDRAWGETSTTGSAQFTPGEDAQGPLNLGIAVNRTDPTQAIPPGAQGGGPPPTPVPSAEKKPKGRLVVLGNTEFASNNYISQVPGNRDLFVNSVNWLAEDEDLISIRAVPSGDPPIFMTNQTQVLMLYATVLFLPLAVLLIGGTVWWQRR